MELKKERKFTRIERLKHSARRRSINEGVFATIKGSLGESYVTPFAIAINASNFLIGIFSSLSGLLGPLSQWQSSRLIEKYKRKNIVVKSVFLESITWLPLAILAFLFYKGIIVSTLPFVLLLFFSLYIIFANASGPAWFSWVGDLVKEDYRGEWFAKRNFKIGIATFISTLAAAFFLDFMKSKEMIMFGFIIMFLIAMVARLISCYLFTKTYEPKLNLKKGYYFSFWEFIKKAPHNNFGRFVIFRAALNFAICIGSPFFAVYMLRDLQFNI
jgi:MFS family permease